MANIIINDILDELREENNRLFDENKVFHNLLDKYRKCLMNFQNICECNQKSSNNFEIKSLEYEYQSILDLRSVRVEESLPKKQNRNKSKNVTKKISKIASNKSDDEFIGSDNHLSDASFELKKTKRKYIRKKPLDPKKNVVCDYAGCNQQFRSNFFLQTHIRRKHTFIKPFKCEECHKCFYTKLELKRHRMTHSTEKSHHCELCDKWFSQSQGLDIHTKAFHTEKDRTYKCELCTFETKYKSHLRPHIKRVHTTHAVSKCDVEGCDKTFTTYNAVKRHKSYFHSNKRYPCDWPGCGREFKDMCAYEEHKRTHLGVRTFKCPFEGCDRAFIMAKTLSQHKQFHLKKFVCSWPECGQRFALRAFLTAHQNRHQNIRPFKCSSFGCSKDFYDKQDLNLHIRTHHRSQ